MQGTKSLRHRGRNAKGSFPLRGMSAQGPLPPVAGARKQSTSFGDLRDLDRKSTGAAMRPWMPGSCVHNRPFTARGSRGRPKDRWTEL